jgi:hypothetical protein
MVTVQAVCMRLVGQLQVDLDGTLCRFEVRRVGVELVLEPDETEASSAGYRHCTWTHDM